MKTRILLYAFLAFQAIHAAANNEPARVDELVDAIRTFRPAEFQDVLCRICESGHYEMIGLLQREIAMVWGTDGARPIVEWAVQNGHPEAARAVINGMEGKQQHLEEACARGHMDLIELLLADPAVDPAANDQAALIAACEGGHISVVDSLCRTRTVNPKVNGYEPVRLAIGHDHFGLLRYMLACPRRAEFLKPGSRMPVYEAMRTGKLEALVILMERGHDNSHALLDDRMKQTVQLKIIELPPKAVQACITENLESLKVHAPNPFHSLDEIDVLLGLARHSPEMLTYLKERQHEYLVANLPNLQHILDIVENEQTFVTLLKSLEARQAYNFLTGKQLTAIAELLGEIKPSSQRLNAEDLFWLLRNFLPSGFKRID